MGSYREEKEIIKKEQENIGRTWIACVWSFLVSMTGGLTLGWWEYKHHPTNSQLWMVPFSLILLVTPVIIWFSVFSSAICDSRGGESQRVTSLNNSVCDPER
ncbi:hypothetical protein CFOL_v3_34193 [Cephalotus follicularis]|uniref:Uncharacterized protein n=1 Tax=Cephalotus follicularis TaxID=3775 RepID=A0A1Q3DED5_CEPFO|nr:hypothetical protein CFOL_v3_34193 [Cephalotus follicularis]